jgi:hypothetical protein
MVPMILLSSVVDFMSIATICRKIFTKAMFIHYVLWIMLLHADNILRTLGFNALVYIAYSLNTIVSCSSSQNYNIMPCILQGCFTDY